MPVDSKSLIIGAAVAAVGIVGGVWVYKKVRKQSTVAKVEKAVQKTVKRIMGANEKDEEEMTPCQRAARARAMAQGAVGTIPLDYGTQRSPMRARRVD